MMLTFGSLFAGIGGFDLGLERAGMRCAWQVEIDDYCQRVLAKHWPDIERYADVRECGAHNLKAVDLICGGFPCQPHSVAGKRRGAADDRNLWPEYRRIVAELRPQWVLGENVPGIITTMLDEVLFDLESEGYACTTIALPAVAFDAPHRRDRVFIVAHANEYAGNARWPESERQQWTSRATDGSEVVAHATGDIRRASGHARPDTPDRPGPVVAYAECNQHQSQVRGRIGETGGVPQVNQQRHSSTRESGRTSAIRIPDERYVADAESEREAAAQQRGRLCGIEQGGETVAYADGESPVGVTEPWDQCNQWAVEPDVGRVAHGVPHRVDRLRALGNAVVPQVAEWIARRIIQAGGRCG